MKKLLLLSIALVASFSVMAAECVIVPRPVSFEPQKGKLSLTSKTVVYAADKALVRPATMFCSYVAAEKDLKISVAEGTPKSKGAIVLLIDKALGEEEYQLDVTKKGVVIKGGSEKAVFYGLQSLRQVVFHSKGNGKKVAVECMTVKDKPHFGYRGGMLDVCRHIFSVDDVKKYIDILALHKANRFHWHLTEDQGWRIEIKKYPELTKIGSMRSETAIYKTNPKNGRTMIAGYDGKPHGGYFTQEQVRDIVRYAAERYIDVIPEIDMPGHMVAALATYPELGCTKGPYEVRKTWGIAKDILCAGRESTFEFVEGVLEEVLALFPSKYIHIGGDEAPKHRWKVCPDCQKRIQEEGLKDEHELQSYFMKRVEKFLAKNGRNMIGWDEILEGGVSKTATVMAWRGAKRGILAAKLGNKVIMTPSHYCYMDYAQTSNRVANGEPICGGRNGKRPLSLRKVYSFDPYDQLNETERKVILGVQGNMWTEYVATFDHLQQMILPRMAAIAEVGWSYGNKDYDDFSRRMHLLRKLYDKCGFKYAPYFFNGIE
ncbi:MAG: beta-N-acetylhexosaminidase [Alistipes sp.]|nr:beta-N-acetylhexosaminidase [Alistipes sp.]